MSERHHSEDGVAADRDMSLIPFLHDIWQARLFLILGLCCGFLAAFCFMVAAIPQY